MVGVRLQRTHRDIQPHRDGWIAFALALFLSTEMPSDRGKDRRLALIGGLGLEFLDGAIDNLEREFPLEQLFRREADIGEIGGVGDAGPKGGMDGGE